MSDKPLLEQHILKRLARSQSTDDLIGEQICEAAIVGLRWTKNSSLEEWFPFTAESIARLEAERGPLRAQVKTLREALERIEKWSGEFPAVNGLDGKPSSYGIEYGSDGERDFMRQVARAALKGETTK